jgi:hypothetical protein
MIKTSTVIIQSLLTQSQTFNQLMEVVKSKSENVNPNWNDKQWGIHLRSNIGRLIIDDLIEFETVNKVKYYKIKEIK